MLLVSYEPLFRFLCGGSYDILKVWLLEATQIINQKEVWLALQGNNECWSGRLDGDEKLIML